MAQTVKHLPAVWKTWVWSLGREDSLEKGMAPHSSILAGKSHGQRSLVGFSPWGGRVGRDWSNLMHRVYIIQEEDYNHTLRDSDGALDWAIINSVALSGATNLLTLYWASPWLSGKDTACQCRRQRRLVFDSWVKKICWWRAWQPTPVFLPGEAHGQRSLGAIPWSRRVGHDWSDWAHTLTLSYSHLYLRKICHVTDLHGG